MKPQSAWVALAMLGAASAIHAQPWNVLFIAIDDLNDWTGALKGHPQSVTPNLDRLASQGMLFANAHCAAPACNPSRTALMTGIRPSTSGIYLNPQPYFDRFPLEEIVLPGVLEGDLSDVPAPGLEMAKPEGDHATIVKNGQWKAAVQGYLACIHFVDRCVGRVMDALDEGPNRGRTVVVLWSDHGWHLGEKEHWRKFSLWEEATQVPMIWRVPGMTEAGSVCHAPVSLLDIYPTLLDVCGLPPNSSVGGKTLRPLLQDANAAWEGVALTTHGKGNHTVRDRRYRYIRYADGSEELYDHLLDPMEWRNLAGEPGLQVVKERLGAAMPK